jgi:thiosulfate/3-mercaptopyruvate sulfurtransferase
MALMELEHLDEGALARHLDGSDGPEERRRTMAHLAECAACRTEWSEVRRILSARTARRRVLLYPLLAAAAAVLLWIGVSHGPAPQQPQSLVVTTAWLADHLTDPDVVVLHLDATGEPHVRGPFYADGHIPGSRELTYARIIMSRDGLEAELPPADSLRLYLESLGVSNSTHVILSGGPVMVGRAFFTLCYLGLTHVSVLDGGVTRWRLEGRPVATTASLATRGRIAPRLRPEILADREFVQAHLGRAGYSFVDGRTPGEYNGGAEWHGVRSTGHLEGARNLEWRELFVSDSDFTLRPRAELEQLVRQRVTPGDTVVAYCFNGGRSSTLYFAAVLLGYPAKLYDGSYEDWSKSQLPTVQTPTPLLTL